MMNTVTETAPLIITLKMDTASQFFFDKIRTAHFPKHINFLKAHITLFHQLPYKESLIQETLFQLSKKQPFLVTVSGLKHMENGVSYSIDSSILQEMHLDMQHIFKQWLCRQDAKKLGPHITVQNKVTNYKSQQLFKTLSAEFNPFKIQAVGLQSWLYLNGPWKLQEEFLFNG